VSMKRLVALAGILLTGCFSEQFYDSSIGNATTIGVVLPTENLVNFEVFNSLDGCRIRVKEPCCVIHEFAMTNSTTWFGLIQSDSAASSKMYLIPTNAVAPFSF